jgi:hypothetical protein
MPAPARLQNRRASVCASILGLLLAAATGSMAFAQVPAWPEPSLQGRIPEPLPPPPQPPIINGPLSQGPPPGVYLPPRINSYSDRVTACLHAGSGQGLRGRKLDAYTRACANPN